MYLMNYSVLNLFLELLHVIKMNICTVSSFEKYKYSVFATVHQSYSSLQLNLS